MDTSIVTSDEQNALSGLSKKHQRFLISYLRCWNKTEAYMQAYGCDYDSARSSGPRLLLRPEIQDALRKHSAFEKTLAGKNTPTKINTIAATWVYVIRSDNGLFKIGVTNNVATRLAALDTASPVVLSVFAVLESNRARSIEAELHKRFTHLRKRGEWFSLGQDDLDFLVEKYGFISEASAVCQ